MMDLTRPTDHQRAYPWAAVLLAHAFLGLFFWMWASFVLSPLLAASVLPAVYIAAWEGGVQRLAGGWLDAMVDAAGFTLGAASGVAVMVMGLVGRADFIDALQRPVPPSPAALSAAAVITTLGGVILAGGIWRRR